MRRFVAAVLLVLLMGTAAQAYSLVSIYEDLKTDFPTFTDRLIAGGATEAEIEAFLVDLGTTVQSYGALSEENFEARMYQALKDVLFIDGNMAMIQEEHFNFTVALLFEFSDEINQTLESKTLSGDLALLSEAVQRALLTPSNEVPMIPVPESEPEDLGTLPGAGLDEESLSARIEALSIAAETTLTLDFTGEEDMVLPALKQAFETLEEIAVAGDDGTLYLKPDTLLPGLETAALTLNVQQQSEGIFDLSMQADETPIHVFNRPLKVGLTYLPPEGTDPDRLTVLYTGEDGLTENLGGFYQGGRMVFETRHFSQFRIEAVQSGFSDVPESHFAKSAIETLAAKGIISGKGDGTYDPEANITRAEAAALIARMLKLERQSDTLPFSDVPENTWYTGDVLAAYDAGMIAGRGDGTFDPLGLITRQEVLAILSRALVERGWDAVDYDSVEKPFDESQIDIWARADFGLAIDRGLMDGLPETSCIPVDAATRAEVASMLQQMLNDLY